MFFLFASGLFSPKLEGVDMKGPEYIVQALVTPRTLIGLLRLAISSWLGVGMILGRHLLCPRVWLRS